MFKKILKATLGLLAILSVTCVHASEGQKLDSVLSIKAEHQATSSSEKRAIKYELIKVSKKNSFNRPKTELFLPSSIDREYIPASFNISYINYISYL